MEDRRASGWALACSFLVYLIPLVGPHGTFTFALALAGELSGAQGERQPLWSTANLAVAVGAQVSAWVLLRWFFRRPGWRRALALPPALTVLVGAVSWTYLLLLPTAFLVEADGTPERGDWTLVCSVPDAALEPVRWRVGAALERAGEALLRRSGGHAWLLLRMPGCEQHPLNLGGAAPGAPYLVPGGRLLYYTQEAGNPRLRWWYLSGTESQPQEVAEPENAFRYGGLPVLSSDGGWLAWIRRDPQQPQAPARVLLRSLSGGEERSISLAPASPGGFALLGADLAAGKVTVVRNEREIFEVTLDGSTLRLPFEWGQVAPLGNTIRVAAEGWVAWDGYKERDSYHLAWSLPAGRGTHRVPRGRLIQSVGADPSGKYVALSIASTVSLGNFGDAAYVLQAADGQTVFRRNLPRFSRPEVTFLGAGLFAYTHFDGQRTEVRVLRAPES